MIVPFPPSTAPKRAELWMSRDQVRLKTQERVQFIDITDLVRERVRRSEITEGLVCLFTLHTTAAICIQEDEPFLMEDFKEQLERWAPRDGHYRHNDLEARRLRPSFPMLEEESENGDAHARAALLGPSETLQVIDGQILLGAWQKIFWVELDGPRERSLSLLVLGANVTEQEEHGL